MSDRLTQTRLLISAFFLMCVMTGLGYRLAFLHVRTQQKVDDRGFEEKILAGRGAIYDRNGEGNILALNLAVKDVCADPDVIVKSNAVPEVAAALSDGLGLAVDVVAVRIKKPGKRFAYVKRFVHEDIVDGIRKQKLTGVFFREATIRHYPQQEFMCHVLGFVNHEAVGSAGIEQYLDRYLRGSPGLLEGRLNALRQELYSRRDRYIPALEGARVVLTLDQNIQYMAEKALDEAMVEHHAKAAWVVVERIQTGEILAMASRPCYDLNRFTESRRDAFLNRAIGCVYEPGSVFKAVVIAAALNEGIVTPETVFHCENGAWMYKRRILRDYHPYGKLTVADILKKSSNIGTAKIALKLGDKRLYRYLRDFGIGMKAGVDLPGEEHGILHPVSKWSSISATRIAIGQGVAVTALQMLGVYQAIANDGVLMRPYVVNEVTANGGMVLVRSEPQTRSQPISYETAATMRRLLSRVTEQGGTGRRARVGGFTVAGKTGTAQKPEKGGYSSSAHMASFVGFLPAERPEIAIIVTVDEPQPLHTGGRVAGPVFSQIAGGAVRYLGIMPAKTDGQQGGSPQVARR